MYNIFNKFREKGLLFCDYVAILFYCSIVVRFFPYTNHETIEPWNNRTIRANAWNPKPKEHVWAFFKLIISSLWFWRNIEEGVYRDKRLIRYEVKFTRCWLSGRKMPKHALKKYLSYRTRCGIFCPKVQFL